MKILTLLCLFFAPIMTASAYSGGVSGKVLDEEGKPLSFANVVLLRSTDSSLVKTEVTDDKGEYYLTPLPDGGYILKIVLMGYETYRYDGVAIAGNNMTIPDIRMQQKSSGLKEVTVSVQKPLIEAHADKLVVNVENSIISSGSSVLDVLSRSPGVIVDQNDNISLKGKQGVNVMIDGRILPISAADLANMLKSMPSNSVDQIEIISNPSAKYDAAGTAGIINIKTKKDNKVGLNGSVNASYAQGVYAKENIGFSLNYRQKKLNVYASYNANYRTGFSHVNWNRQYYKSDTFNGANVQENYTVLNFHTNIAAAGIDYNISKRAAIGLSVTGENFYLGTKGYYYANIFDATDTLRSHNATNNTSGGNWNNYAPNIHFMHTFDSTGKQLTIDGDYARYWNNTFQDFTTMYTNVKGAEFQPRYILHGDVAGLTEIQSFKADYENPLKNNAKFETGIKASYVTADNEPRFYDRSNGGNRYDPTISDHYLYNEQINAAYVHGSKETEKWSMQAGLRVEQTVTNGKELVTDTSFSKNYAQLFPSLAVQNHMSKNNDLGVTLSRRIERPEYKDLNPYIFFVDPNTYKVGNPQLQPALTWSAELSHVYKQRFITTLSYSITDNVITEVIKPSITQEKVTIQTKDNLATMHYIGISGSYTIPLQKWWTNVTNFDAYYAQYQGNLSNTNLNVGKPTFDINTSNKFTLGHDWSAELTIFYQAAQVYGFLNLTPISMFNLGLQKLFFDKKLIVRASANDIFLHGNESGSSYFVNYKEAFVAVHDTRQVAISVTYRFGKKTVTPVRKHSGGAEEEKKRASEGT